MGAPASAGRWNKLDTWLLLAVLVLAAGLRIARLAEPNAVVFDETYYAKDACLYLGHTQQFCGLDQATEQSYVHPPLGKWLISFGIRIFGYNSFGWRFSAAIFGTAIAGLTYLLTRKLFKDRWAAGVAGALVATDFLLIVQSRIAMLDIFLAFFVLLGFVFLVMDRQRVLLIAEAFSSRVPLGRTAGASEHDAAHEAEIPQRGAWWRLAAGVAFGLALAVKWSAIWALIAAVVTAAFWSLELIIAARKSRASFFGPARPASLLREILVTKVAFLLGPLIVYVGVYAPYFIDRINEQCPYTVPASSNRLFDSDLLNEKEGRCIGGIKGAVTSFGDLQDRMLDYHLTLNAKHTYQSKAWSWPLVLRPVAYFYEEKAGESTEVIALGNLATWWGSLAALAWLIYSSLSKWRPQRLILVAWVAQYLPWLVVSRPLFFFYMTPAVPFMMIGLAVALAAAWRYRKWTRWLVLAYLVLGVGAMLVFFYPVIEGVQISRDMWQNHMWIPLRECGGFKCGWI
ncbi:MAG: phospholipid carrier-dependent glycosyltransferase [Actinomycetota bacterium]